MFVPTPVADGEALLLTTTCAIQYLLGEISSEISTCDSFRVLYGLKLPPSLLIFRVGSMI